MSNMLISSNQANFIKGRYIKESVVTAYEIIHSICHKTIAEVWFLKLDYEKAYDKTNWDFLLFAYSNQKRFWREVDT
jgi:hypothetical protein